MHADWCLLLARTDPQAPKRRGISYFLMDMRSPGIDVRPIRQATGESHFCEIFLDDVRIPAAQLIGPENAGWQVAQSTLGAERGLTMLELAERLGNAGFRWLVEACGRPAPAAAAVDDDARAGPAGGARDRDDRPARAVPRAGGAARRGHCRSGRRLDRQALLQRAAAADDGFRRRGRPGWRPTPSCRSRPRAGGSRGPGCSISSVRGSGRSRAGRARSSAPSSASGASACRVNRRRADGAEDGDPAGDVQHRNSPSCTTSSRRGARGHWARRRRCRRLAAGRRGRVAGPGSRPSGSVVPGRRSPRSAVICGRWGGPRAGRRTSAASCSGWALLGLARAGRPARRAAAAGRSGGCGCRSRC